MIKVIQKPSCRGELRSGTDLGSIEFQGVEFRMEDVFFVLRQSPICCNLRVEVDDSHFVSCGIQFDYKDMERVLPIPIVGIAEQNRSACKVNGNVLHVEKKDNSASEGKRVVRDATPTFA